MRCAVCVEVRYEEEGEQRAVHVDVPCALCAGAGWVFILPMGGV